MKSITAIILTKNEELNIEECLKSIENLVQRIVIVDCFSTDKTKQIATNHSKVEFYEHEWSGFANQFNYALDNCDIDTDWILKIDADERLSPSAIDEIEDIISSNKPDLNGIVLKFKVKFLGRYLKHGGAYPFLKLSIFKNGYGRMENKNMDEHIVLTCGNTITLKADSFHDDSNSLERFIEKHNKYSSYELLDYFNKSSILLNSNKLDKKNKRKQKAKFSFYYKFPLFLRAKLYYYYRYFIKFGFLDGRPGKCFAFFQAYWYRFLVDAKIYESRIR